MIALSPFPCQVAAAIGASRGADLTTCDASSLQRIGIRLSSKHHKLRRHHSRSAPIAILVTIVKQKKHFGEVRHEDVARSGDLIAAKRLGSNCLRTKEQLISNRSPTDYRRVEFPADPSSLSSPICPNCSLPVIPVCLRAGIHLSPSSRYGAEPGSRFGF